MPWRWTHIKRVAVLITYVAIEGKWRTEYELRCRLRCLKTAQYCAGKYLNETETAIDDLSLSKEAEM
ncbi:hypothetical protein TNCV_2663511 [Trichonephila clavipes]|nr:hypothetical protein TNCV_2663511 [Trichonephila clavipes]